MHELSQQAVDLATILNAHLRLRETVLAETGESSVTGRPEEGISEIEAKVNLTSSCDFLFIFLVYNIKKTVLVDITLPRDQGSFELGNRHKFK